MPVECDAAAVDVGSVFGRGNASVRARVLEPLERLGRRLRLHAYFPEHATVRAGLRAPARLIDSEIALRRLIASRPAASVVNREVSPFSRGGLESELLSRSDLGVLDIDDALHLDVRRGIAHSLFPKPLKAARAAEHADVVVVGNDFLADWASSRASDVRVIPTCVEPARYRVKHDYALAERPRLLWLGTRSGERYLQAIAPTLAEVAAETGARLTIFGDPDATTDVSLREFTDRVPWRPGATEASLHEFDVGLMPLLDTPYERGKCAYKLLEYGAAALPVVASPVGVNAAILAAVGSEGPLMVDWGDALRAMLTASTDTRAAQGRALRAVVVERFSFDAWLPEWERLYGRSTPRPGRDRS